MPKRTTGIPANRQGTTTQLKERRQFDELSFCFTAYYGLCGANRNQPSNQAHWIKAMPTSAVPLAERKSDHSIGSVEALRNLPAGLSNP